MRRRLRCRLLPICQVLRGWSWSMVWCIWIRLRRAAAALVTAETLPARRTDRPARSSGRSSTSFLRTSPVEDRHPNHPPHHRHRRQHLADARCPAGPHPAPAGRPSHSVGRQQARPPPTTGGIPRRRRSSGQPRPVRVSAESRRAWLNDPHVTARFEAKRYRRRYRQCRPCLGAVSSTGHGSFRAASLPGRSRRGTVPAHLLAFQLAHGAIPRLD